MEIRVTFQTTCPICKRVAFRPLTFYENRQERPEEQDWENGVLAVCECGQHFLLNKVDTDKLDLQISKWHKALKRHM